MSRLGALHLIRPTGPKHSATLIFFHGSGSSGDDMLQWVQIMLKNFSFPHIKVMFPTAPLQPYTPLCGEMSNVWFDRNDISIDVPENVESLSTIKDNIKNLIQKENEAGIPSERIVVGGFSMGGALALHTAYRWDTKLAGVFAFSSFLNNDSIVFKALTSSTSSVVPPLLQIHGDCDDLVYTTWGEKTFNKLTQLGVNGEFHMMNRLRHSINKRGLILIKNFVEKCLPEV